MRSLINILEAIDQGCPEATYDLKLNLENRQKAIEEYMYGPADPSNPGDYWERYAEKWKSSVAEVSNMLCGNCAAFDVTTEIKNCIEKGIEDQPDVEATIEAGELGYCQFLKFKCAAKRTCSAWVTGGPITDKESKLAK